MVADLCHVVETCFRGANAKGRKERRLHSVSTELKKVADRQGVGCAVASNAVETL